MTFSVPRVPLGLSSYAVTVSHQSSKEFTPREAQAGVLLAIKPTTFTLSGTLTFTEPYRMTRLGCEGSGANSDALIGTAVIISDRKGRQVAVGALQAGKIVDRNKSSCEMTFTVPRVPLGLLSYSVSISHLGIVVYPPAHAQAGIALTITHH